MHAHNATMAASPLGNASDAADATWDVTDGSHVLPLNSHNLASG